MNVAVDLNVRCAIPQAQRGLCPRRLNEKKKKKKKQARCAWMDDVREMRTFCGRRRWGRCEMGAVRDGDADCSAGFYVSCEERGGKAVLVLVLDRKESA